MSERDDIRAAMFADDNKKPAIRQMTLFGQKVDIHQPTLGQMSEVGRRAGQDPKIPPVVRLLIMYTYVRGTDVKVFDDSDAEQLASMRTGKWLEEFNTVMAELSSVDVQAAEKNSEETA